MAKKEPTIEDMASTFWEIINRAQIETFLRNDRILYGINKKKMGMLIVTEPDLWCKVFENQEISDRSRELNPTIETDRHIIDDCFYVKDMENGWINIEIAEMEVADKIEIKLEGFKYPIEINKNIWPIRFKKAEFNEFAYKIYRNPKQVFVVRKKFQGPVENSSFYICRIFTII